MTQLVAPDGTRTDPPYYRWAVLAMLTLMYSFNQIDRRVMSIVMELVKAEFDLTDSQLGILTGLGFGASYALASIPFGLLVDRVNRRKMLAVVFSLWSLATSLGGLVNSFMTLLLTRILVGAFEAGGAPTAMSLVSDYFPPRQRATASTIFLMAVAIGSITCFLFGAWIASLYGWRTLLVLAGLPGILLAGLIFAFVREPKRGGMDTEASAGTTVRPGLASSLNFIIADRRVLMLIIGASLAAAANSGIMAWLVSFLMREHALDIQEAGAAVAFSVGIFSLLGLPLTGLLTDRFARGESVRMVVACAAACFLTYLFACAAVMAPSLTLALAMISLFGLFCYANVAVMYATLVNLAPLSLRGTVLSVEMVGANLVGYGGGPFVIGVLSDYIGGPHSLRWALLISNSLFFVAMLCMLAGLLSRRVPQPA